MSYHYLCPCSQPINTLSTKKRQHRIVNVVAQYWWMCKIVWEGISLNEPNSTQSKGDERQLPYNFNFDDSFWGRATRWMRELSKSHYSRRICLPQCVRVIQTRKVRTGQNTSIYHRMNGINGYEFELLFKWVTKLYLWERRVLRIGFTSVKPKPGLLRETLKKLIIPIGANIVFTRELDKAWIIIDTVLVKPFNKPCT